MHLASLRDGSQIYPDDGLIVDQTEHPAFRNAVRGAAYLYDPRSTARRFNPTTTAY